MIVTILALALVSSANAAERFACTYKEKGETVKIQLSYLDELSKLIQMHAPGGEPDRYFAQTKGNHFTEFATRLGTYKPLILKTNTASQIVVEKPEGGNLYTWKRGKKAISLKCP